MTEEPKYICAECGGDRTLAVLSGGGRVFDPCGNCGHIGIMRESVWLEKMARMLGPHFPVSDE